MYYFQSQGCPIESQFDTFTADMAQIWTDKTSCGHLLSRPDDQNKKAQWRDNTFSCVHCADSVIYFDLDVSAVFYTCRCLAA